MFYSNIRAGKWEDCKYNPGAGAKRWPGFWVNWEKAGPIERLVTDSRLSGSGADHYSLVLAPAGWAENISRQFIDERDFGTQYIAYRP